MVFLQFPSTESVACTKALNCVEDDKKPVKKQLPISKSAKKNNAFSNRRSRTLHPCQSAETIILLRENYNVLFIFNKELLYAVQCKSEKHTSGGVPVLFHPAVLGYESGEQPYCFLSISS